MLSRNSLSSTCGSFISLIGSKADMGAEVLLFPLMTSELPDGHASAGEVIGAGNIEAAN